MAVIKDVAKLAGVSPSTVSKYLNYPSTLKKEYKERIHNAIMELNYTPSNIARSMRTGGKTNLIAVIVPDIINPFYTEMYNSIRIACSMNNYIPILYTTEENTDIMVTCLAKINARQVDGVIVCFLDEENVLPNLEETHLNMPISIMSWNNYDAKFNSVVIDVFNGFYTSTSYLIKQGRKKIAFISGRLNRSISQEKLRGFKRAMNDNDMDVNEDYIETGTFRYHTGFSAAKKFMNLQNPPDAIVAGNDVLALGAIKYLLNYGYKIPEDVAVIGYDGIQLGYLYEPSLSTIAQPIDEMGELAVNMLLAKIKNPKSKPQQAIFFGKLVERRSTNENCPIILDF